MTEKQKKKDHYYYNCKCGRQIEIDDEHKDFFFGHDNENKILVGECPECGEETLLFHNDIGKTVLPLYKKAKFKFKWEDN